MSYKRTPLNISLPEMECQVHVEDEIVHEFRADSFYAIAKSLRMWLPQDWLVIQFLPTSQIGNVFDDYVVAAGGTIHNPNNGILVADFYVIVHDKEEDDAV